MDYSMFDGRPWSLYSSILIGLLGGVIFMYGKKHVNPRCLMAGLGLCVFPYFVTSLAIMWGITGATVAGLYLTRTAD